MTTCRVHGEYIPFTELRGYAGCPKCRRQSSREWQLRNKFGITPEDYYQLLALQGGVCAICGNDETGNVGEFFCVDHNHDTGKVRGLLCALCNKGLGHFQDDPAKLRAAIDYLERILDAETP